MGLIVLQVDETIETEFRQAFNDSQDQLFVTRIPSGLEVTAKQLSNMEGNIKAAAICYHSLGVFCCWLWMYFSKRYNRF